MKIAIVGAGPAGSTASLLLAESGQHEVVLLDRDEFPRTKACGSGLGPRCVSMCKQIGLYDRMSNLALGIRGLRFVAPAGSEAILSSNREAAWIIPRKTFDAEIAFRAEREGARFVQGFKAIRALRDPSGQIRGISDSKTEIEADLVLFCDGAHSRFSIDRRPKRQIATIMGWYEGVPYTSGVIEMFFDRRVRPWYGWLFPETLTRVNIGICYNPDDPENPKSIFAEVVERNLKQRFSHATQIGSFRGAPICYTRNLGPVTTPGALYVGESARLTNAATGEGIYYAMKSAWIAAQAIARNGRPCPALYTDYAASTKRTFTLPLHSAVCFMNLLNTSIFDWASSLITCSLMREPLRLLLSNV